VTPVTRSIGRIFRGCIFGHDLAVVTIFCMLTMFLFPVSAGPYSAVHGPATALVALRAAMKPGLGAFPCHAGKPHQLAPPFARIGSKH